MFETRDKMQVVYNEWTRYYESIWVTEWKRKLLKMHLVSRNEVESNSESSNKN